MTAKIITPQTPAQADAIDKIKEALALALEHIGQLQNNEASISSMIAELLQLCVKGEISSVGIVGCKAEGFFSVIAGRQAADINLACDELKKRILEEVLSSTAERQSRRGSIFRN